MVIVFSGGMGRNLSATTVSTPYGISYQVNVNAAAITHNEAIP